MAYAKSPQVRTCGVKGTSAVLLPIAARRVFGAVTNVGAAPCNAAAGEADNESGTAHR